MDFQVSASLDNRTSSQTSLGNANQVDLFVGEVRIVVQLVADDIGLPAHTHEHGGRLTVSNLNTLNNGPVVDGLSDAINPALHLRAAAIYTVEECHGGDCILSSENCGRGLCSS